MRFTDRKHKGREGKKSHRLLTSSAEDFPYESEEDDEHGNRPEQPHDDRERLHALVVRFS